MVVPSNVSYWRLTLRLSQHQKGHAGTTVPSEELTWPRLSLGSPDLSLRALQRALCLLWAVLGLLLRVG